MVYFIYLHVYNVPYKDPVTVGNGLTKSPNKNSHPITRTEHPGVLECITAVGLVEIS